VGVSGASRGERIGEWSVQMQAEELVTVALANLSLGYTDTPQEDMSSTLAMASARISRLAAQHTRSTHEIRRQLCHSMQHSSVTAPDQGVHVLAGPSGAGKSLMVARLAQHASVNWGSEQVAVISYSDQRAGAWNQAQLLSAQSGVDCFRATNVTTLKLLLEEHGQRKFLIIDTPGVQMAERVSEIVAICKEAQFHVVLPADASQSSLRRVLSTPHIQWQSLMISKLDEASQPWALIQVLTEGHVGVSGASRGERIGEWSVQMQVEELVTVALANLSLGYNDTTQEDMSSTLAMASARISRLAAQHTRSTHE